MIRRQQLLWLLAPALLAACRTPPPEAPPPSQRPAAEDWRVVALAADRDRLGLIDAAWQEGLAEARSRGFAAALRAQDALLDPAAALPRAAPPPGSYRCRLVRLGGPSRAFAAFPDYFCHVGVEGALLSFTKQTGSERPGGYLFEDSDLRLVFLGATATGEDAIVPAYGEEPQRDAIGVVERIGAFRYRLVMPWPRSGARLDVLELVAFVPGE